MNNRITFLLAKVVKYDTLCGFLFMGWFLHYSPFFLMARQLFLHHYFPALYFAILLFSGVFDLLTSALRPRVRMQIALVLIILAIWNFQHLSPLTYGNPWTKSQCEKAKWLKTWDFSWYVFCLFLILGFLKLMMASFIFLAMSSTTLYVSSISSDNGFV
jgi:dolichyl-phosphate-mannose-protein mannosyltransferase